MDYVYFVYGLSFILIAALCRRISESDPAPRAWLWLAFAGLFNGLSKWLDMLAISLVDFAIFPALRFLFLCLSLVALVEFGRRTLRLQGRPVCGPWLAPLLALLACLALPHGLPGLKASVRYAAGLPAGLLAAFAVGHSVWNEADTIKRRGLLLAAIALFVLAISEVVTPKAPFVPASWLNHESFLLTFGFPIQALRASIVLCALAGIWNFRNRLTAPARRAREKPWLVPLVFTTLITLGWGGAEWRARHVEAQLRAQALEQSASLAQAIHPLDIKTMTFTPADRETPRYKRLTAQLAAIHRLYPCRAIYTLALREGRTVYGPHSPPAAPASSITRGCSFRNIEASQFPSFHNAEPFLAGPVTHADGTFITAYAPICDPRSGETLLLVGVDWPLQAWRLSLSQARLLPIVGTLFLLLALLACLDRIPLRDRSDRTRTGSLQHLEALMIVICGVAGTLFFALVVREMEIRRRQALFDRLADSRAGRIRDEMYTIRADLAAVARFFESSITVTPSEFHTFAGSLLELNSAESLSFIRAVRAEKLSPFLEETKIGTPDFTVWEMNAKNRPVAVSHRPVYYPVLYTIPDSRSSVRGFDIGSEPTRRASLETVLNTGLPGATAPLFFIAHPQTPPSIIASHPVAAPESANGPGHARPLLGFINALISPRELLLRTANQEGAGESYLELGLFDLTEARQPRLLAALPHDGVTRSILNHLDPRRLIIAEPLFIFGRTYVIVSKPTRAFMAAHPIRENGAVWLVGLLLTLPSALFVGFLRNRQIQLEALVRQRTEALEESEAQYRLLAEHASDVIGRISPEGRYLYLSPASRPTLGYEPEELVGWDMLERVHPADAENVRTAFRKMLAQPETITILFRHRHKDGSYRWLETSGKRLLAPETGEPREVVVVSRDVSDRKKNEEERLEMERHLLHTQKLESLGVLTGGIAHDFNNLLAAVLGNLELTQNDLPPHTPARLKLEQAAAAAKRAADLTRQMLDYSGKGLFLIKAMNLNGLIEEKAHLLQTAIPQNVTLKLTLSPALPDFRADPDQIQQVVMNLITNASEAIGERTGTVSLSTGVRDYSGAELAESRLPEKPPPGRFVFLDVADTGCGMSPEVQQRLFEPFFTTKFTGRGLGMSAVLGIVRGHHGALFLKSMPNLGTVIRILFPAPESAAPEPNPIAPPPAAPAGEPGPTPASGFVLIVDDEEIIRSLCKAFVMSCGYRTLLAQDGEEALRIFREKSGEILAVILDLTMPRMDGCAAYHEMRRIRPDVKVIISSGHAEQASYRKFDLTGIAGFLQKPYEMQTLEPLLQRVLGSRP
ncbi:MAG: CHASE domain-containing protein [Kiritimatiellia bacterium]